jgi:hypothetical protein
MRGVIRDIARPLVKSHYGLEEPNVKAPRTVHNNRRKVEALVSKKQFCCKLSHLFCDSTILITQSRTPPT